MKKASVHVEENPFHKFGGYEKAENVSIDNLGSVRLSIAMLAQGWGCA